MTATAAPALAVLCSCGHAARMHDEDGCVRIACGCSRNRAEAADVTPVDDGTVAEVVDAMANSAVSRDTTKDPARGVPGASTDVTPAATPVDSAPVPEPSPGAGAETKPMDGQTKTPAEAVAGEPAAVDFATLAQALKAGRAHDDPRIKALATRIDGELLALTDQLAAYDTKRELRAERDRLLAELAQVEAELNGDPQAPVTTPSGRQTWSCETCGQTFDRPQGLGAHRRYKHNGGTS